MAYKYSEHCEFLPKALWHYIIIPYLINEGHQRHDSVLIKYVFIDKLQKQISDSSPFITEGDLPETRYYFITKGALPETRPRFYKLYLEGLRYMTMYRYEELNYKTIRKIIVNNCDSNKKILMVIKDETGLIFCIGKFNKPSNDKTHFSIYSYFDKFKKDLVFHTEDCDTFEIRNNYSLYNTFKYKKVMTIKELAA